MQYEFMRREEVDGIVDHMYTINTCDTLTNFIDSKYFKFSVDWGKMHFLKSVFQLKCNFSQAYSFLDLKS